MTTRNQMRARDAFIVALLAGAFYLLLSFYDLLVEDRERREAEAAAASQPMREEDFWPQIRPCEDELWNCIRHSMARTDI